RDASFQADVRLGKRLVKGAAFKRNTQQVAHGAVCAVAADQPGYAQPLLGATLHMPQHRLDLVSILGEAHEFDRALDRQPQLCEVFAQEVFCPVLRKQQTEVVAALDPVKSRWTMRRRSL